MKAEFKFREGTPDGEILDFFYLHLTQYFDSGRSRASLDQLTKRIKIDNNILNIEITINGIPINTKEAIIGLYKRYNNIVKEGIKEGIDSILSGNSMFDKVKDQIQEIESKLSSLGNWLDTNIKPT